MGQLESKMLSNNQLTSLWKIRVSVFTRCVAVSTGWPADGASHQFLPRRSGSRVARTALVCPQFTGQIDVGVLLGATGLHLSGSATIECSPVVTEFASGVITLAVGDNLNVVRLRNAGRPVPFAALGGGRHDSGFLAIGLLAHWSCCWLPWQYPRLPPTRGRIDQRRHVTLLALSGWPC